MAFRTATKAYTTLMRLMPNKWKYPFRFLLHRNSPPYSLLRENDVVVQVGSARDVLASGRSRCILFAYKVPKGRVVVIEPDPKNCADLKDTLTELGLTNVTIVEKGAWEASGELELICPEGHPAANILAPVRSSGCSGALSSDTEFQRLAIRVDTLDSILKDLAITEPAMAAITVNLAELKVLNGMTEIMSKGCRYVSLASVHKLDLVAYMNDHGYQPIAGDDRGVCFKKVICEPTDQGSR